MIDLIKTTGGKISWREFENENIGLEKKLFFDISIEVEYKLDNVTSKGKINLDFIEFSNIRLYEKGWFEKKKTVNWPDLANQSYSFPINPTPGYIDGSFCLTAHNPCDVNELKFSQLKGDQIMVSITGSIDFSYEGVDEDTGTGRYDFNNLQALLKIL